MNLAYLGPPGTYSEQAAHEVEGAVLIPFGTIPAAVRAVEDGAADAAVVPVENSLEGAVTQTADLLIHHTELRIRQEIVLDIHHCLLTQPGVAPRDVSVIYSHPQALAQCRAYVARNLPGAEPVASLSTAAAVSDMRGSDRPAAAISSERAAELFDAAVADRNIEDVRGNKTRFVMLAPRGHAPERPRQDLDLLRLQRRRGGNPARGARGAGLPRYQYDQDRVPAGSTEPRPLHLPHRYRGPPRGRDCSSRAQGDPGPGDDVQGTGVIPAHRMMGSGVPARPAVCPAHPRRSTF